MRDRKPPEKLHGKAQKEPPSRRGGERERRQGTGTSPKAEPTSTRTAHPVRYMPETALDERGASSSVKALIMPYRRSRLSLRFIVGDQHNTTTSTTREPSFGSRKHGVLTSLAQRTQW